MAELTDHDVAILKGQNFAHFVTLNEDGSAHAAPLWIDVDDDGLVLVNSAVGRKKDRNIRRDPRVVVSVHAQDDPYTWTAINGTVVSIETGEVAEQHIDFLNQKYHDGERWEYVPGSVRVLYRIRPDRIVRGVAVVADAPLAARMRPRTFEEFVGQTHVVGPGTALTKLVAGGNLPSIILWGPAGTGKTTLAHLLADARRRRHDAALGGVLGRGRRAQGDGGGQGRAVPHRPVRRRGPSVVEGAAGRPAPGGRGRDGDADRRHHREPLLLAEHAAALALPAAPAGAARARRAEDAACSARWTTPSAASAGST